MRKSINRLPTLLAIASLILSGCGARQCLHTTMGCETESSGTEKPRRELGGSNGMPSNRARSAFRGLSKRTRYPSTGRRYIVNIGTRSVLYGAHCAICPSLVPRRGLVETLRLPLGRSFVGRLLAARHWVSIKVDMGGNDGETHVELGARIMA